MSSNSFMPTSYTLRMCICANWYERQWDATHCVTYPDCILWLRAPALCDIKIRMKASSSLHFAVAVAEDLQVETSCIVFQCILLRNVFRLAEKQDESEDGVCLFWTSASNWRIHTYLVYISWTINGWQSRAKNDWPFAGRYHLKGNVITSFH